MRRLRSAGRWKRPKPFVESGWGNQFSYISSEHGIPFPNVSDMGDMIPFQRYVLMAAAPTEDDTEEAPQPGAGGGVNPYAEPNGGSTMQGQRTVFTNTHEYENDSING